MALEIERKFLVKSDHWRAQVGTGRLIRQGYLSANGIVTVRVRTFDDARGVLTLKGAANGLSRAEYEYDIPIEDARELLAMAGSHVLEKRRYELLAGPVTWEIDVFKGRHSGLVMAEVELQREDQSVQLPEWVGEEVSSDAAYTNAALARA